jgi:hypothetical protein
LITLFTGVERVYDSKRRRRNERGGEERDSGAKREVARQRWRSDNQPAQVRPVTTREAPRTMAGGGAKSCKKNERGRRGGH